MKRKTSLSVIIGSCLVLLLAASLAAVGCAKPAEPTPAAPATPAPAAPAKAEVFNMSDSGSTDLASNPNYVNAYVIFQDLEKYYPGQYELAYHASSALYNDRDAQAAVFAGDLDACRSHCGLMLLQGEPISNNFVLGLLPIYKNFDDNQDAWLTFAPAMSKDVLEPRGAFWAAGTCTWGGPLLLCHDTTGVADMKGFKIRNPGGDFEADMMRAMGMNPVSMAQAEVATSLQTGVIDGAWTSLRSIYMNKQYKMCPYMTPLMAPGVSGQSFLLWSLKSWARFPADVQDKLNAEIIPHSIKESEVPMRKIAETGLQLCIDDGAIYSDWSDEAIAEYYEVVTPVVLKYAAGVDRKYREMINKYSAIDLLAAD
jgi:TRAP-type C4-dicarboxylate transport system substrate-binding protein